MTTETTATGPITYDDVATALGQCDPFQTNAGKLRDVIGRGSNVTIQKHLDTIRNKRIAEAQPGDAAETPKAPQDVVDSLWTAAWSAAQTKTLARLEALTAERDGLNVITKAQAADLVELSTRLDSAESAAALAAADLAKVQAEAEAATREHAAKVQELETFLRAAADEVGRVEYQAKQAAEIAIRDAQIERQAMQATIDRLTDQLGELKALRIAMSVPQEPEPETAPEA